MTVAAGVAFSPPPSPLHADIASIGSGVAQAASVTASLVADAAQSVADFFWGILPHPGVMAAGIVLGLILAGNAWLVTFFVLRHPAADAARPAAKGVAAAPKQPTDLQTLSMDQVKKKLGSSPDGLSADEAIKRLAHYGANEIEEKKTNIILVVLKYFWGPIPWMIEVACVLSAAVRHWPDFFIILLLLCANATIGFFEEHAAGNAIDALKARLAVRARAKRDGKWITPPATDLVPGDLIRLRSGDIVPADARLPGG